MTRYLFSNTLIGVRFTVDYTNWKGERKNRDIEIDDLWFGSTEYHKEKQLLARCFDYDKKDFRDFAVKDFHWDTLKRK